ncbi:hypothetical protein BKA69DRAFT_4301 [Paraphysoderma sedebokerense]|nr:hypothetical protein BKA69DRAFT_4301 [Paraphysoderma sedebokerense]
MTNSQNYSCPNVTWISHANIRCDFTTVNLPLSEKFNVTVTVGNRTSDMTSKGLFGTGVSNNPPNAMPLSVSTFEEQSLLIQFGFSDPDGDDMVAIYITTNPTNGSLYQVAITGDRGAIIDTVSGPVPVSNLQTSVLYVPLENFNGYDNFTFKARDSWNAESSVQNASITVISVPDAPIPKPLTYALDEDTEVVIQLEIADADTPLEERLAVLLSLPQKGSLLVLIDASWDEVTAVPYMLSVSTPLKYSPINNYFGTDSFIYMANDGSLNSTVNATITLTINSVNDPPFLNTTNLNVESYEDSDIILTFDISDIDVGDKVTVKITDIYVNGSLYIPGLPKEPRNLLGEGSELRGPPYQVLYSPAKDFFTSAPEDIQSFNVTYSDISNAELLFYQVSFNVLPINDPPTIPCTAPLITLPPTFLIGQSPYHSFSILATDVDDLNLTFVLKSVPSKGILRDSNGLLLQAGSAVSIAQFIFETNGTGGGYPYSNFTIFASDAENATSNECTFNFTFTCPPGLYNNIFKNGKGEICEACPLGGVCSTDGSVAPRPQLGWWRSEESNAFLECFPASACTGTAENTCAEGYEGQPRQGPAVGYDITVIGSSMFPPGQNVTVYVGGKMCPSVLRLNSTAISCRTPPGTGQTYLSCFRMGEYTIALRISKFHTTPRYSLL